METASREERAIDVGIVTEDTLGLVGDRVGEVFSRAKSRGLSESTMLG